MPGLGTLVSLLQAVGTLAAPGSGGRNLQVARPFAAPRAASIVMSNTATYRKVVLVCERAAAMSTH
jgi:hypothetical protein